MAHLGFLSSLALLLFFGRWNRLNTIMRITSIMHDGGKGYDIVMTTSLSSDVPVGYFSWAEYDIMALVQPKTENTLAAAFISNCGARNFHLQALVGLENVNIKIDSYGGCHRNREGKVDKVETLRRYKFSLAFENSNEEDYVTEKFFQSLAAGSVPVVIGAPNIQDFAPSPGSLLHIKDAKYIDSIAQTMKHLAENPTVYNESLRWKYEGPSDSFKALIDMAAVHSSCRLCIYLATKIQEEDETRPEFRKRPCKCISGLKIHIPHICKRKREVRNGVHFLKVGQVDPECLVVGCSIEVHVSETHSHLEIRETREHTGRRRPQDIQNIPGGKDGEASPVHLQIQRRFGFQESRREKPLRQI